MTEKQTLILAIEEIQEELRELQNGDDIRHFDPKYSGNSTGVVTNSFKKFHLDIKKFEIVEWKRVQDVNGGFDDCELVIKYGRKYYKMKGSYCSYEGTEYDFGSFKEVTPQKKEITIYE